MLLLVFSLACDVPPTCLILDGGTGLNDTELAELQVRCAEGQTETCDPETFLGVDAAECLATWAGLADGLEPWETHLGANAELHRVVWSVANVDTESGAEQRGTMKVFDAITGEPTGDFAWQAIP